MTVEELLDLLASTARFDDEEDVDLLTHGLQCAENLAAEHPSDLELQVAGLVHDVGHVESPDDPAVHDRVGAEMVRPLLGDRVAWLVGHHVTAKRYLVTADPAYRAGLSPRSIETLALEGEELTADETAALEASPDFEAVLALRRADEAAKDPHRLFSPSHLARWRPVLEVVADS